jgi:superfamily II DNA/RNA helicase
MTQFSDLSLDPRVLSAVIEAGYTTPTPIQIQAIPHALEGRDVLGIAQTGTGKTAGFVLPMITLLQKGRARARMPRSLVLCPTRELAAQVAENFEKYAKNVKLTMALLIGGVSFKDQDKLIDRGVDVLIATPGRLLDHFERGKLMLTGVQIMVVDEADRMLDMGFIPDIERIFKMVPFTRQTLFFSATMAPEITRITQEFLHNPVRVEVSRQATASETIVQFVVRHTPARKDTGASEKRDLLRRIILSEGEALTNGIIFCNRKVDVDVVAKSLKKHGFDAAALHGDLDQSVRTRILNSFRDGELKLLVASDVAARGLDIPNVSHVFNFDVPIHSEDYVHRIGRTGRAGRAGRSITLCLPHEVKYLDKIEELVKKPVATMENPMAASAEATTAPGAPGAPETRDADTDAPRKSRGARRSRGASRASTAPPLDQAAAPPPAETVVPAEGASAPGAAAAGSASRPERAVQDDNRRRRNGDRDRDQGRPGMGDHVPAFLLREFRIEVAAFEDRDEMPTPEPTQSEPVETAAPPAAEQAATPEPARGEVASAEVATAEVKKPKPRAPRRRSPAKKSAPESLEAAEAPPSAA